MTTGAGRLFISLLSTKPQKEYKKRLAPKQDHAMVGHPTHGGAGGSGFPALARSASI